MSVSNTVRAPASVSTAPAASSEHMSNHNGGALAQLAPRRDLYLKIHKGLRALMCDVLVAVGRMDPQDDNSVVDAGTRVRALLAFCRAHLAKEDKFIHPAMDARRPRSAQETSDDHLDHQRQIDALELDLHALERVTGAARDMAASRLYRELALFVAENFQHMHVEETRNNVILWGTHTDAELKQVEQSIIASIPPQELMGVLRWMVPYSAPAERAAMFREMKAGVPADAFWAIMTAIRPTLSDDDWNRLNADLEK